MAREGGVQHEGKWVQGFAEVPREAVEDKGGGLRPPRRRAAQNCAGGSEAEREAGGRRSWTSL